MIGRFALHRAKAACVLGCHAAPKGALRIWVLDL